MFHLSIVPFPIGSLGPLSLFPALLTEIVVFFFLQRRNFAPFPLVLVGILLANLPALFVGYALLGVTRQPAGQVRLSIASFLISWTLSVAIEYGVCRVMPMIKELPRLLMTVAISSTAGYAVLAMALWRLGPLAVR